MMEWAEYIGMLLKRECAFDDVLLSINGDSHSSAVPPIIKASILMLDRMISVQGQHNVIIFPEKSQSSFIFALVKLLHSIAQGQIDIVYNPDSFKPGEKLKFEKCVVEFEGIETRVGKRCIKFKLAAGLSISAPIEILPLFQRTSTNRPLSTNAQFAEAKRRARELFGEFGQAEGFIAELADHKTYLDSSVFYVAPIGISKEQLAECLLNGFAVEDILLVGQTNFEGEIRNISAGQLSGIPPIVLSSDLYAASAAIERGAPIQSLIFDVSNTNALNAQLDKLDELIRRKIPIICITDIAHSFDLQPLVDRGFNIWRWDEDCLTGDLYDASRFTSDKKIRNCARRKVEFVMSECEQISDSLKKLNARKVEVQGQSPQMIELFDKLFSATFLALRAVVPPTPADKYRIEQLMSSCVRILESEKAYLSEDAYRDYFTVTENLLLVFSSHFTLPKIAGIREHLKEAQYPSIVFIVPNNVDKHAVQKYWEDWCLASELEMKISAMSPSEYFGQDLPSDAVTIVAGWLNGASMRNILYGFNTEKYVVFLYDYERRWKNTQTSVWTRTLNRSDNKKIVRTAFNTETIDISISRFRDETLPVVTQEPEPDELSDIELVLRENKYRQYVARGGQHSVGETVEAVPVNFIGGYIAFFRTKHKVITATDIIVGTDDEIKIRTPQELEVGDFIVVREADRDLIKDLADIILRNSGKGALRARATKWKETLILESGLSSSHEQIYRKLLAVGSTATYQTVRSWITDDDKIAPDKKEDLIHIAQATGDDVLFEMADQIYDAAREVRRAHVQAGQYLSAQLKMEIAAALSTIGDIDRFNIWDPITMQLEDIGTVKILKVIDIGTPIVVDITNTNHLLADR